MELVIDTKVAIDDDGGMVVVTYIDDILITTKGSMEKHHRHVSKVFQLLMDNHMCVGIDQCILMQKKYHF
jgi:microsomal dipeptidase-like Zn-dependent dipeptidase